MSRAEDFDRAIQTVTIERGQDYGHPLFDFELAQNLIRYTHQCQHPAVRHALQMICVKMARLTHNPDHLDSWIDIAGYARTALMALDKEEALDNGEDCG